MARTWTAIVLALAIALVTTHSRLGQRIELASVDLRYELADRAPSPRRDELAVLAIDERSDAQLERSWPYPRSLHARALRNLADARVRAVVLDVQFLDPTERAQDDALVAALAELHERGIPVVLATAADPDWGGVPLPLSGIDVARDDAAGVRLERSGARAGRTDTDTDVDGVVRSAPRLRLDEPLPSLAVAAIRATGGDEPAPDADDRLLSMRTSTSDLLAGTWADAVEGTPDVLDQLADRIVFVGATSAVLHDQVRTPLDERMPGVVLHAQSYLDLRDGSGLDVLPAWVGTLAAGVLALALALFATGPLRRRVAWWTLLGVALPTAWVLFAAWAFVERSMVVPVTGPVLSSLASLVVLVVAVARHAVRERRRVAAVFSRYLAPRVVRQLLAEDALDVAPGGSSQEITVLFSDVRGFTELTGRTPADELVAQLNEYFDAMVAAVDEHEGTVDKFIGDGLMAFFGAPAQQPDHAERACATARSMHVRLVGVNEARAARGLEPLEIAIGIATGTVVVGNVGSSRRLEYTAIGDAVNLAARLEASAKQLGVSVLVSGATASAVDAARVRRLDPVAVRGFARPIEVAELVLD